MPKIHNHHLYGKMCHQGQSGRTGMRMPHKYHISYNPSKAVNIGYKKTESAAPSSSKKSGKNY